MPRVLLAVLVCALAGGGVAWAQDDAPAPVRAPDARGDARTTLDLTRVQLLRSPDGRLRASITLADGWDADDLEARSGPPGSVCLKVWTTTPAPDADADVLVCATSDGTGRLRGSVLRQRANQLPERVASAVVTRPSARSVTLRFSPSALGRPPSVRVAAETTRPGCARASCIDTAPDAPNVLELTLRSSG